MKYILTYTKINVYLLILAIIFRSYIDMDAGLYFVMCGIFIFFIQSRIVEIRKIIGISNSILFNYLNILPCSRCKNGITFSSKNNNYQMTIDKISHEMTSINKISIIDNKFSYMAFLIYCYYSELNINNKNPKIGNMSFFNYESFSYYKLSGASYDKLSSAKIKLDYKLIKEIIKIY